jgi:hypothetical protein
MKLGPHPSHQTRFSDASTFDEICEICGAHDEVPGGWGKLADPCPGPLTSADALDRGHAIRLGPDAAPNDRPVTKVLANRAPAHDVLAAGPVIRVWRFGDAPQIFQALSPHGGDEDWVALVPAALTEAYIPWLDFMDTMRDPSRHQLEDGSVVVIGSHA